MVEIITQAFRRRGNPCPMDKDGCARAMYYGGGRRTLCRRPASSTPTTNRVSHQSSSPPPLLLGAVTVSEAELATELPPAGAVESALAAIAFEYVPEAALFTLRVIEQLPSAGTFAPAMVTVPDELVKVPDAPAQVVVGAGEV